MTKTKKQRNHVLIRRVKRTSAAILLVMAVVVAAIPVENLGTVQAEDTDTTFDMGTIYSEDTSGDSSVTKGVYTSSVLQADSGDYNYEKNFTGESTAIKVVQQVSGSSTLNIEDVYKVTLSSETTSPMEAVVSGIGTMTDITVNSEEFYGLVMFRVSNKNINVEIDSLQVTFASGSESTSDNSAGTVSVSVNDDKGYYQVNGTGTTYQASTINSGTLNKVSSTTYTGDSTVTLNSKIQSDNYTDDSNGYNDLYGGSGSPKTQTVTHKTLIDGAESTALAAKKAAIDSYNSDLASLAEIATKLSTGTSASPVSLTQAEYDLWTKYASDYSNLETAAKTLSISKSNFVDEDNNGLADVYDYIICNYYGVSGSNNLKGYALVAATYKATGESSSETVYVAKLTGQNAQIGQYLYEADGSKYLATGKAKIVGVLSEAFKGDTTLTSILLPSSIEYIGESAFESCSVLSSVTLDATSCVLIGDSAFKNSGLTSFTISKGAALKSIGVCAFENTKLPSITIPASVTELCNCSFMGISTLKSVEFSSRTSNNITIGKYAFYNCNALTSVEFGTNSQTYYIQKGAFAVDHDHVDAAMDFSFPSNNYKIDYSSDDNDSNTTSSTDYNYILAGRRNLGTVTFTLTSGTVPTNTLRGCYNLECAVFINNAANAGYTTTYENGAVTATQLFSDVTNDEFYVKGPATKSNSTTVAQPRSDSWTGILGYTLSNGSYAPVPYMYEINGETYIDLGYNFSGDLYVATVKVLDESAKTAELSSYQVNTAHGNPSGYRISIEIPDEVGGYKIVSIGESCFTNDIKNIVYEIIIPDGYITEIGEEAFSECSYLERVYIGSSVTEIGDEAFADCPMLENVEFGFAVSDWWNLDDDEDAWTELKIGDNAFQTKSEHLTFHGAINDNYAPYALAMGDDSDGMTTTGAHICYKTDAPLNLTVLRNESTKEATLVDYPHYDEIDDINKDYIEEEYAEEGTTEECTYSITEGFEDVLDGTTELAAYPDKELDMVEAALYLNLPSGIKSVDSKLLFEGSGSSSKANDSDDKFYVNKTYEYSSENAKETTKINFTSKPVYEPKYWTTDERSESRLISYTYAVDGSDSSNGHYDSTYASSAYGDTDVSIGGLFSGYFNEDGADNNANSGSTKGFLDDSSTYGGHTYVSETYESGNDYLTSVDMPDVTALTDYVFDSCENLLTAAFTDAMESMGALPFRNCKAMYSIDLGTTTTDSLGDTISTNGYFAFKNLILYAVDDDGSYEITEVLEGRGDKSSGSEYLGTAITKSDIIDGGANVTSIADGAFSNNENLGTVDLSDTEVVKIPEGCFENDMSLYQITLPDTTRTIDANAFDTGCSVTVYIPNNLCTLSSEAKTDGTTLYICGEELLDDGSVSPLYYSYEEMLTVYSDVEWVETESECVVTFLNKDLTVLQQITVDKGGSLSYIPTAQKVSGYDFECWLYIVSSTEVLSGTVYTDDIFTDITENRTYYPSYTANPSSVESDGNSYVFQFENCAAYVDGSAITSGTTLTGGTTVTLLADADTFTYWTVTSSTSTDYTGNLESGITQYLNTFTMPNASVKVTANLTTSSGSSGSSSSDNDGDSDSDGDDDEDTYTLTVNYGSGSGDYEAGTKVTIAAYAPESSTKVFSKWTTTNSDVGFASATAATTTIVMPSEDVTVTANYKTRTSDDDDDDDDDDSSSSSSRTSVASTTTAANGTNGSGSSTTTTSTTTTTVSGSDDDGNKIYITKNGISNKDVASITVEGSTDNFIVRISESDEATEAAKLALTNEYGSLDNLVYFPMDISLYDATGQNKITDSYGLNITVTMPIPDVLIQYGGNARVAACDDGVLTQLTPKFTTIDGIACISFTPPHFSPYVIYVDTSNLTAGTLDSTPKTGDPIHPKWFLAIGLGCASVVLFATSDGRRRRKFRTV